MADLLTHVSIPLVLLAVAGRWIEWVDLRWIAVAMGGAIVPDLSRFTLVADSHAFESATGVAFSFGAIETLGGVLIVAGLITVAFERTRWPRVYVLLVFGGATHLAVDALKVWADGSSFFASFPFLPSWRPPTPNLYVSSDPIVPALTVFVALVVFGLDRRMSDR